MKPAIAPAILFLALSLAVPLGTRGASPVAAYALALRRFNPRLDAASAATLAIATIVQADRAGLDARLLVAVIAVESRWNPAARSRARARSVSGS